MIRELLSIIPAYVRELLSMIPAYVRELLMYATFCISNPHVFLVYATVVFATRVRLLKMSKNTSFEFQVVWVVMQLTPSVVTTLSSPLTLS